MGYRNLTDSEITLLQTQGCYSDSWKTVYVKDPFYFSRIRNCSFYGTVKIGILGDESGDTPFRCGLYHSDITDCVLGDRVFISHVSRLCAYDIDDRVTIEHVGSMSVDGETAFGNGTEINVLNEGGGRTLPIYEHLTSQIAYLLVVYRHRPLLIERITSMIRNEVRSRTSSRGKVGKNAVIVNCQTLRNLCIGSNAKIEGALCLEEGTVASDEEAPTRIGHGVYAKHFIVQTGSSIDQSAILTHVFVGQAVKIGKQYSAEHSVFFANCEGFHGEACSIFAGPYTVTHHKSSLLIAGLFSFFNAGSGTNQSNHMYKLGPNHQGILQRGSKTGSFSYLLWPCAVGAFSVVIGKHYGNFDTTDFPFSYINEEKGKSVLTPAMNLFTVGTRRDSQKWPSRDRRNGKEKLDLIHFDLYSPFIMGKIRNAITILQNLYDNTPKEIDFVQYKGIAIKRLLLKTCRKYYEIALKIFWGECIMEQLKNVPEGNAFSEFQKQFSVDYPISSPWIDLGGMLIDSDTLDRLLQQIENNQFTDIQAIMSSLRSVYEQYDACKWGWCCLCIESCLGWNMGNITKEQLCQIIGEWKENRIKLNNMIIQDAQKEFDQIARIGYGIDGDDTVRDEDFMQVRGNKETNSFIRELQKEILELDTIAADMKNRVNAMPC